MNSVLITTNPAGGARGAALAPRVAEWRSEVFCRDARASRRRAWHRAGAPGRLPATLALESIACGTPVVAFNAATGLPDAVDHLQNGYLARALEPEDLAHGIVWTTEDVDRHDLLSQNGLAKAVNEFSLERQIRSDASLFGEVVEQSSSAGAGR